MKTKQKKRLEKKLELCVQASKQQGQLGLGTATLATSNKNPIQIFLQIIIHQRTELGCRSVVVGLEFLEYQYYHNSSNIGTGYNTKTDRHTHLQETVIAVHTLINTHTHTSWQSFIAKYIPEERKEYLTKAERKKKKCPNQLIKKTLVHMQLCVLCAISFTLAFLLYINDLYIYVYKYWKTLREGKRVERGR